MAEFVHLHLHTHFSFLDAMNKIPALMTGVRDHGQTAVAVTEHGNLCSTMQFYEAARKAGVKPIIGCEIYVTPGSHKDRKVGEKKSNHLVLLAMDATGYQNLIKLVSAAHLDGMYYRPRVDHELLEKYNEGLIATSGCMSGEIPVAVLNQQHDRAKELLDWYAATFEGRFYLEVQRNSIAEQEIINDYMFEQADRRGLKLVATNDCHYLRPEDAQPHDILLCVGTGKTIHETKRKKYQSEVFYLRSSDEMATLFPDHPEALVSTMEIAERCNLDISTGGFIFPRYDTGERTTDQVFEDMTHEGLKARLDKLRRANGLKGKEWERVRGEYEERLAGELELIEDKGFAAYLLIVQDFMNWARRNDVPVGPGRGSAAGSLACYALGITDIDPIRYGLLFERFMNPERADNPDIDCDFCAHGREKVIEYVTGKYGADNVCQIATFGTLKAKAAIRDVGRALGYPYGEVDKLAKLIPGDLNITLDDAMKKDSELRAFLDANAWAREIMEAARALEGTNRQVGKHAAGLVIAPRSLTEYVPLMRDKDGYVMTQWDKGDVEKSGLIKFDFLGLKTLTIIDKALALIRRTRGETIDMESIPMDDAKAFDLLCAGQTTGVFQLESRGMKDLLIRIAPRTIDDIIALVALYRPGPIQSGMIDTFIASKRGEQAVVYELPELKDFLEETHGMMVYQEQVMQVANTVAGFSLGQSDLMRRAMSKKDKTKMAGFQEKFLKGAAERKIPSDKAQKIWDLMEKFAEYGFNKSHSAAYGVLAYQTAYLKANYSIEFMASLLTMDTDDSDKLHVMVSEVRDMGIEVLPPDINASMRDFTVQGDKIRYGLAGVKNVGGGAVDAIIAAREKVGSLRSLPHMLEETEAQHINRRVLESLVRSGAFDGLHGSRARLLAALDAMIERAGRTAREREIGQTSLFGGGPAQLDAAGDAVELPAVPEWTETEVLENEKLAFGFFLTGHPLRQYAKLIRKFTTHTYATLREITGTPDVVVAVLVTARKFKDTARGRMAILEVEDLTGTFEAIVYAEAFARTEEMVKSDRPLLIRGRAEMSDERGPKVFVNDAEYLEDSERRMGGEMSIRLGNSAVSDGALEILKRMMESAKRGRCRPVIRVAVPEVGEAVLKLPPQYAVEPTDELVNGVEQLFGRDVVMFS